MYDDDCLEARRRAIRESIKFFSQGNKGQRELWAVNAFLKNLNIPFAEAELVLVRDDPPDVCFRDARFEVKEIMDCGRPRHDEYKKALTTAEAAINRADLVNLVTNFIPKDMTLSELYDLVLTTSGDHAQKYAPDFSRTLDLLLYVNLQDVMDLIETPFPDVGALQSHPWRSVSFFIDVDASACVLAASSNAPTFLYGADGKVIYRRNPSV